MSTSNICEAVSVQKAFYNAGHTQDISSRVDQLKKLKTAIHDYEEEILEALTKDLGKSATEGFVTEVHEVIREINYAIKHIKKWTAKKRVATPLVLMPASSHIRPESLGCVLVIGAWNYPFALTLAPAVSSIAAGNTTIMKPPELAPHTEQVITRMVRDRFQPEMLTVITGGIPETTEILKEKFDHIFFTGGGEVGKIVMTAAAKHLTPVTLELGGKSPCIVDDDISLEIAAKRIAWGKYINAGQTCVAPDYIFVKESLKGEFLGALKKAVLGFFGPDPKTSPDFSRIISTRHLQRLKGYLDSGTLFMGGEIDEENRYMAPTVLTDVSPDSLIMQEEIFGPILPVLTYTDLGDVISFINDRPKPLALYVFSNNKSVSERVTTQTSSGGVCINDVLLHATTNHLPFGGVGPSGMGSYHGKAGFDALTHSKSILQKPFNPDMFLRYAPHKKLLRKVMNYV